MGARDASFFRRAGPTRFMYSLGKALPPPLGLVVVWVVQQLLILLRTEIYLSALSNMRHVLPPKTSWKALKRTVRRQIYLSVLGYYHFFHNVGQRMPMEKLRPPVKISAEVQRYFDEAVATGRGLFILGTHTSNFDLCGLALAHYLPRPPLVLSISDPEPGVAFMNDLRAQGRGEITPISSSSLRDAMQRLREGGIVMTGVDRPVEQNNGPVTLFGATAHLPTGYIRIPLMTDCLVITVAFHYDGEAYWILANSPMEMIRTGDRDRDVNVNLQCVLAQVESFIRRAPEQWMVFVPVWHNGEV